MRYSIFCSQFTHITTHTNPQSWLFPRNLSITDWLAFFFLIYLFNLFFNFWLHWIFVAVRGLPLVAASGGYSSLQCAGFSLRWLLSSRSMGSRYSGFSSCGTRALERRLNSCGALAYLLCGMWDLPGPGIEPMSPALVGGFLTTAPPGKPLVSYWSTVMQHGIQEWTAQALGVDILGVPGN